jgi:hypothetical protein
MTYSKDGDLKNMNVLKNEINLLSKEEAWERLVVLSNYENIEVSWNTSLFVAFVSSFVFLACVSYAKEIDTLDSKTTAMLWFISIFTVFGMQDIIFRWKMAHRKQSLIKEKLALITKLRLTEKSGFVY